MMKTCIFMVVVAIVASYPSQYPLPGDENSFRIYTTQRFVAGNILDSMRKIYPTGNLFFSPHSIYRALLLAYIGAEGATKTTLDDTLFLFWADDDKDKVIEAYRDELAARNKRILNSSVQFNSIDKFYITKNVQLK